MTTRILSVRVCDTYKQPELKLPDHSESDAALNCRLPDSGAVDVLKRGMQWSGL